MECIVGRGELISQTESVLGNVVKLVAKQHAGYLLICPNPDSIPTSGMLASSGYLCITPGECVVDKEKLLEALRGMSCQVVCLSVRERLGDLGV